jgi:hypothetical protein
MFYVYCCFANDLSIWVSQWLGFLIYPPRRGYHQNSRPILIVRRLTFATWIAFGHFGLLNNNIYID